MASNQIADDLDEINDFVELWVNNVVEFSSQYNTTSWAANCVIGEPTVYPRYGDINGAWAQANVSSNEFIVVEFSEKVFLTAVEIYETLNAGAVVRILAYNPSNEWNCLWEAEAPQLIQISRIFSPPIREEAFSTKRIKLELNCTSAGSWCEIDAVKIKGKRQNYPKPPSFVELTENLRELVNSPLFSDVKFAVEGREIYAHRAILAVRSSYFRALLCNGMLESRLSDEAISVDNVTYSGFIAMMHFIYTNTFDASVSPSNMTELIRVGDKFSLNGMKILSFCHLCRHLTIDNVVDIYRDAVEKLPRLEDVEDMCLNYISKHLDKISNLPAFCNLAQNLMLLVIQGATAKLNIKN